MSNQFPTARSDVATLTYFYCNLYGTVFPRQANNIPDYLTGFKKYNRVQVEATTSLELWMIPFPIDYMIDVLITKTNILFGVPTYLHKIIACFWCWYYMAYWVGAENWKYRWSNKEIDQFEGEPFWLRKYISRSRFKISLHEFGAQISKYNLKVYSMRWGRWGRSRIRTYPPGSIQYGWIFWTKTWWSGLSSISLDSCEFDANITLLTWSGTLFVVSCHL